MRVKSSTDVGKLASAIFHAMEADRDPVLECVGAASVNAAVKAVVIASMRNDWDLAIRPVFDSGTGYTEDTIKRILFEVLELD